MRNKIVQTVLPYCTLLLLVIIAIFAPVEKNSTGWIPLTGGLVDGCQWVSGILSVVLMVTGVGVILSGLYLVLLKTNTIPFGRCAALLLMLLFSSPHALHFNTIYLVLACIVWAKYCILERQIFVCYMLLSLASLFYAPAIWLVPAFLLMGAFSGMPERLRSFVKSLSGASLPHIYILVFRWIRFDDADVYLYHFAHEATALCTPFHQLGMPDYFFILCMLYMLYRAISFIMAKNPMGMLAFMLKTDAVSLFLFFILFLFFSKSCMPVLSLLYFPAAVILAYYFKNCGKTSRTNVEMLLLMSALLLGSLSHIV